MSWTLNSVVSLCLLSTHLKSVRKLYHYGITVTFYDKVDASAVKLTEQACATNDNAVTESRTQHTKRHSKICWVVTLMYRYNYSPGSIEVRVFRTANMIFEIRHVHKLHLVKNVYVLNHLN